MTSVYIFVVGTHLKGWINGLVLAVYLWIEKKTGNVWRRGLTFDKWGDLLN
jgi:hypothetical protein